MVSKSTRQVPPNTSFIPTRPSGIRWDYGALVLLLVALVTRLIWLDRASFRADTIHFWSMAQQNLSFAAVWSRWMELMGWAAQFPFPAAAAMVPTRWLGLPHSMFSARLSDALFGVVAIMAAWMAGRAMAGRRFGFLLGLFIAINPLHIQLSREAYFYSSLLAGAFTLLACMVPVLRFPTRTRSKVWLLAWTAGLFLTAYSHFTGWILVGLSVPLLLMRVATARSRQKNGLFAMQAGLAALFVALPLTWLPWAIPYSLKKMSDPSSKAESIRVMGEVKTPVVEMLAGYAGKMMWGTTGWGWALLALALLGVVALLVVSARRRVLRWLGGLILACVAGYLTVMKSQGMYEAVRHVCFLFPVFTLLVLYGLWSLPRLRGLRRMAGPRARGWISFGLMAVAVLAQLPGAWAALRITGSATPYKDIQAWCNQNLARGTPILVDRWFEPWNELRLYPTTNLVYMFTRPNEPLDVFLQSHWREGAQRFFQDYPDAAYMEMSKSYWSEPGVGPWPWTRAYFKHHVRIVNEPGLVLRRLGQAFREDFYNADSNRVVVEIFYNTRDDALEKARQEGRKLMAWPGGGWQFMKSGPMNFLPLQTQDFMEWRLMDASGVIELHNLTDQPMRAQLVVEGLAPRGSKTVSADAAGSFTFPPGRLSEWRTAEMLLPPGQTNFILRDPLSTTAPLLVRRWSVEEAPEMTPTNN